MIFDRRKPQLASERTFQEEIFPKFMREVFIVDIPATVLFVAGHSSWDDEWEWGPKLFYYDP